MKKVLLAAAALTASALPGGAPGQAMARTVYPGLVAACENSRDYPLHPRAVSVAGEIVTGYLEVRPHRAAHVRLIPMADGYRYAGRGVWLDGIRADAVLNLGKRYATACKIVPGAGTVVLRTRG